MPALIERLRTAGVDMTLESNFATDNVGGLSAALSLTCYRILEESLTNVVKHSLAKRVVIQLTSHDDSVAVAIHDPGPPDSASIHPGGRGVRGMRERVEAFGGSLEAVATPGGGFRVSAVIPKDAA